ncbi:hypothetical protein [Vulcanisaeta sp. JCM 14467]|uniref:hypothetical protein n=1 Tax=Vulcanisaeta sp. JCM 14467 TaxID=1295370 RepID=UPI0006D034FF|nr:hypothetical protein [Vulcanisaeta sp. JCM 14467]
MIYILGEPPSWLNGMVKELGEDTAIINDCNVPPRSIVIAINRGCAAKGSVILSLLPYGGAILIQRSTAKGVLSAVINLLRRISNADHIEDALRMLGFVRTEVVNAAGMSEIMVKDQVIPGSIYTIAVLGADQNRCVAALGRGTVRGTLILNSSVTWLLGSAGEVYVAKGDLMLELMALSMIFGINFIHSNTPY